MKINKRKKITVALIWAAAILISSLLLRNTEDKEQIIGFLIITSASFMALSLNGANNLSCKAEKQNSKS